MTKPIEYRGYFFSHQYLSSLQKGLQTAHVVAEMFNMYGVASKIDPIEYWTDPLALLNEWADKDKTIIILNGGNCAALETLFRDLSKLASSLRLPWASFREDEESLNNAITCVGIIVPNYIYHLESKNMAYDDPHVRLYTILDNHKLAH